MSGAVANARSDGEELPKAYIVPQSQDKATPAVAENIKKWLAERVSKAKRLEGGVEFIDAIPKNPVRSIQSCELRDKLTSMCDSLERF